MQIKGGRPLEQAAIEIVCAKCGIRYDVVEAWAIRARPPMELVACPRCGSHAAREVRYLREFETPTESR